MSEHPPSEQNEIEERWARVRRMPGVVIHRTRKPVPYVPEIRVAEGVTIDDLLGDDDEDEDEDRGRL